MAVSGDTAKQIDEEVRRIIDECYGTAETILADNGDKLHAMAEALILYETIDSDQIDDIMAGRKAREPDDWHDDSPTSGGTGSQAEEPSPDDKPADDSIGGPAGQH